MKSNNNKVYICWSSYYDDMRVVKAFDSKKKAVEYVKKCDELKNRCEVKDDFDKTWDKAKQHKEEFDKLGLDYNEVIHDFDYEEMEVNQKSD